MNINDFEKLWGEAKRDKNAQIAFWDGRAEEFNLIHQKNDNNKRLSAAIDLFQSKGMLNKDTNVLDIGCGPGRYSIEFAKRAKSVIGIDVSPKMIEFAVENAEKQRLSNISFDTLDWENVDLQNEGWEKKFDIVFASMCPGISSKTALENMINASKKICFVSSFAYRKDQIRDQLRSIICKNEKKRDLNKTIYCGFNILWHMGYYPEITYFDTEWEKVYSIDKAISMYTSFFEMRKPLSNDEKEEIEDYLKKIAKNNYVVEKTEAKIAWMYWNV
ncbi:class I SAM-dependent methyltransferase [Herbivorax sp. ANBcel31]|uniref:class I SAM-dependent methyltransferase n=1 Tax=Herbivorax sp. ANBcel31 TaxID=3069754 RepID=UPI0027B875AA|nr:class I SAM-dependent methyltransferase [Herbivorax sp. ANBcel31]MDQ2085595.1 class I SAM-dependent methyltransferase [Herbivorax sp. ANBcel31]